MRPSQQLGFMSPRSVAVLVILLAILVVPLWWLGEKAEKQRGRDTNTSARTSLPPTSPSPAQQSKPPSPANSATAPSAAPSAGQEVLDPASASSTSFAHNPDAFGMTWGLLASDKIATGEVWMSCHGQPQDQLTQPHEGSCNPYRGDSSCRLVLPVLCLKQDGSSAQSLTGQQKSPAGMATDGWAGGQVASTAPVAGFVMGSVQEAHARCEKELGPGWRMASFHDGGNAGGSAAGWGLVAKRHERLDTRLRHWVFIRDQPGNCWNNR